MGFFRFIWQYRRGALYGGIYALLSLFFVVLALSACDRVGPVAGGTEVVCAVLNSLLGYIMAPGVAGLAMVGTLFSSIDYFLYYEVLGQGFFGAYAGLLASILFFAGVGIFVEWLIRRYGPRAAARRNSVHD